MKRKAKILLISYVSVLVVALALYAWAGQWGLGWYRRTVGESASLAYEETVRSVETLSQVLAKSPYATDPEMCDRICCEAYACAAAAESAMSTLPFSTWELEQLSGFLNTAGDYAYSLCGQGQAFTDKQRQELRELAASAAEFSETLLTLREDLENRELTMDSREQRLQNVGTETGPQLSGELLAYEAEFSPLSLHYDGQYGSAEEKKSGGLLTEAEMQRAAAEFLDLPEEALLLECAYEGADGRCCYRAGDRYVCVSRAGVESMSQSRLVGEEKLSPEEAEKAAEDFLREQELGELRLLEQRQSDSYDATAFDPEPVSVSWTVDEETARAALPEGLSPRESRRLILKSPGGQALPVYAFSCRDGRRGVEICVSAETGKQYKISVGT